MTMQADATVIATHAPQADGTQAGRYFRAMAEFVGFTQADADAIKQTAPIIEQHLGEIVGAFYAHLLRYPPTRKFFLKADGSIDQEYLELRMKHLTAFWMRTAGGVYDDDYACYLEYVGRAHTARGANPGIYIAERYVIGQVGFIQHAISMVLMQNLRDTDSKLADLAVEAWDKLLMVILEMLARAYREEHEGDSFDALVPVDGSAVKRLAATISLRHQNGNGATDCKQVRVARIDEIPDGCRKIVDVDGVSIGVFHHNGAWYALRNYCLHRGGPVATGNLEGDTLVCPWHHFKYNITTGQLLVDPNVKLDTYPVTINGDGLFITVAEATPAQPPLENQLPRRPNELPANELAPGQIKRIQVDGEEVAVYNVDGKVYATQERCTHVGGPLSEGKLAGTIITCPWHGSCFDVTNGAAKCGPATQPLTTYRVTLTADKIRVEK
jgi:nitrite reductase/ring-hydroxylating ferredoxin subunit/hemoglobin-like flavoprotein